MSFKLTHDLPQRCLVAVSGGVDSTCVLHFLSRTPNRVAGVVHVHHGTGDHADDAQRLVAKTCEEMGVDLINCRLENNIPAGESKESFWREARYEFFREAWEQAGNLPIVLGHTMDDCLEEYVMCTMVRGFSGTIPYAHGPCVRPFRLWKRRDIEDYAKRNEVAWLGDPSNNDITLKRNLIRRHVIPRIKYLNPGIYNIIEKIVREQDERNFDLLDLTE